MLFNIGRKVFCAWVLIWRGLNNNQCPGVPPMLEGYVINTVWIYVVVPKPPKENVGGLRTIHVIYGNRDVKMLNE